jgi:hypothetical protein
MSEDVNSRHFNPDDYQASAPFKGGKPKEVNGGIDRKSVEAALEYFYSGDRKLEPKFYYGPKYEVNFKDIEYPRYHIRCMNALGCRSAVFYVDRELKPITEIKI